jgi:protein-disulfide isomerase
MNRILASSIGCALLMVAVLACAQQQPEAAAPQVTDEVVARVGDEVITASEMEEMVGPALVSLRQEMYETQKGLLEQRIFQQLVEKKAAGEGLTTVEYLQKNIDGKLTEPAEDEIEKVMTMYRSRLAQDDEAARQQVVQALQQQQTVQLREELRQQLFAEAGVEILLTPPRVDIGIPDNIPSRGAEDAPVTLIEYTDYQCPYCARVQPTIEALLERYEGKLRHVFKNLPLPMHNQAQLAAQAGLCANDQGKYWEFHNWLFENQRTMNRESMVSQAGELGMDGEAFAGCLDQGTHSQQVDSEMAEARGLGITGTPGFLINGRVLKGAQPIEAFEAIIDDELERKGIEVPPKSTETEETTESSEETSESGDAG